jgi:hypothetical protein
MTDPGFLDRVYKTGVVVWALGFLVFVTRFGPGPASGWTAGSAFSFGVLAVIQWFVLKTFVPGNDKAKNIFFVFALLKMPALLVILGTTIYVGKNIPGFIWAFCAGVALAQIVIILKVAGSMLHEKLNSDKQ